MGATKSFYSFVGLTLLALSAGAQGAAELSAVGWDDQSHLRVETRGAPEIAVQRLQDGHRLRLTLRETQLGSSAADIGGQGNVKGVFPYQAEDGRSVHIDILLREPGFLTPEATKYGYRLALAKGNGPRATAQGTFATAALASAPAPAANPAAVLPTSQETAAAGRNAIESIDYARLPDGGVQIKVKTTRQPDEPGSFSTDKPARIALDFANTANHMGNKTLRVNLGKVESVSAIEVPGRTRVVISLSESATYNAQVEPDGVRILVATALRTVEPGGAPPVMASAVPQSAKPRATTFSTAVTSAPRQVTKVDFRRGPQGDGRVMIGVSDSDIGITVKEDLGELILEFANASVPENLQKRLDVIDFATPVQTIDTFDKGGNARVVIRAAGRYSHMAYQAGDVFTLSIKPLSAEETAEEDELGYKGEKLSLNFQNIEVRAALQVIADFTGINFVTSDAVKGNLTLRLRDVPWDQALDIILRTRGLAKREQGNVIWVAPVEEIAAKEKLELEASKTVLDLEPLVSELIPINYAKASDIAALLKSIKAVSPGVQTRAFSSVSIAQTELDTNTLLSPRGNVTVDERTNSLLIQDTASKIREVKKLITRLDTPVKQVLIETRIVEANDDFSRNLGARLGAQNYNPSVNIPGSPTTNAGEGIISGDIENNITFLDEIAPTIDPVTGVVTPGEFTISNTPIVDLPSPGIGGVPAASLAFTLLKIAAGGAGHLLNLEISALESEGRGKIIANPRLVTANQKQARIEQGQERIFPPSGFSDQPTTVEAKLSLTVTPQVTPEDSIILDVVITQDTFVSATDPTINTKSVNTQVLLNNGETVVIGGIYQEEERENVTKVPILGDMPLIGNAFRNKGTLRNKTELLIFLTPRVISPALDLAGG